MKHAVKQIHLVVTGSVPPKAGGRRGGRRMKHAVKQIHFVVTGSVPPKVGGRRGAGA